MTMPKALQFAVLTVLVACGEGTSEEEGNGDDAPMKEGTWHLAVDRVTRNTCEAAGLSDADLGVGQAITVTLSIDDDGRGFTIEDEDEGTEASYDLDGDEFSREDDATIEVEDPCYLRKDVLIEGRFTSKSFATSDLATDISVEGNCSAVNTDGIPCSYEAELSWEYVGD